MTVKTDLELLIDALAFAAHKHREQRRKDSNATPYINHPIAVASVLVNEAQISDIEAICAALLHDTVEDTETSPEELVSTFGEPIAGIVMEVTDDKSRPKHERKQAQIDHAPHLSTSAKAVKLADKICNLRDISSSPPTGWSLQRRREYFDWAKSVIDGLRGDWIDLERIFDRQFENRP